jgi:hypothetical protein
VPAPQNTDEKISTCSVAIGIGPIDVRLDCMGIVMLLDDIEIVGIDEHGADLVSKAGARQRFRRRALPAHTVPLWDLPCGMRRKARADA